MPGPETYSESDETQNNLQNYPDDRQDLNQEIDPTIDNLGERKAYAEFRVWGDEESTEDSQITLEKKMTTKVINKALKPLLKAVKPITPRVKAAVADIRIMSREYIDTLKPKYDEMLQSAQNQSDIIAAEKWVIMEIKSFQLLIKSYFNRIALISKNVDSDALAAALKNFDQVVSVMEMGDQDLIMAFSWATNPDAITDNQAAEQMKKLFERFETDTDIVYLAVRQLDYPNKLKFFKEYQAQTYGALVTEKGPDQAKKASAEQTIQKIKLGVAKGCIPPIEARDLINTMNRIISEGDDALYNEIALTDQELEELGKMYQAGLEDEAFLAKVYTKNSPYAKNPWMGKDLGQRTALTLGKVWLATVLAVGGLTQAVYSWRHTKGLTGFIAGLTPIAANPWTWAAVGGEYALIKATGPKSASESEIKKQNQEKLYDMVNTEYTWLNENNASIVAEWYTENREIHDAAKLNQQFDEYLVKKLEDPSGDLSDEEKTNYEEMLNKRRELTNQNKLDNDRLLDLAVVLREVGIRGLNPPQDQAQFKAIMRMGPTSGPQQNAPDA